MLFGLETALGHSSYGVANLGKKSRMSEQDSKMAGTEHALGYLVLIWHGW